MKGFIVTIIALILIALLLGLAPNNERNAQCRFLNAKI